MRPRGVRPGFAEGVDEGAGVKALRAGERGLPCREQVSLPCRGGGGGGNNTGLELPGAGC